MPRIVRFSRHGGPEVLEVRDEPLEEPGEGEVRLKIEAFGLNRGGDHVPGWRICCVTQVPVPHPGLRRAA